MKPVRELFGVMAHEGVSEGIFLTTGYYTNEALRFASGKRLHLIDGKGLVKKIQALTPEQSAALLAIATRGDFTTPTCPSCGIKMTFRVSGKDGSDFWGCLNYPRCRRTFKSGTRAVD